MTKIIDEDVIFKKKIIVPEISIEGGTGDLSLVDDLTVAGLATIGETLSVTGTTYLNDVVVADSAVVTFSGEDAGLTMASGADITLSQGARILIDQYTATTVSCRVIDYDAGTSYVEVVGNGDLNIKATSTLQLTATHIKVTDHAGFADPHSGGVLLTNGANSALASSLLCSAVNVGTAAGIRYNPGLTVGTNTSGVTLLFSNRNMLVKGGVNNGSRGLGAAYLQLAGADSGGSFGSAVVVGTPGSTTYQYRVVPFDAGLRENAYGTWLIETTEGPATLSETDYIEITTRGSDWTTVNAYGYNVYLVSTDGAMVTGYIGSAFITVTGTATMTVTHSADIGSGSGPQYGDADMTGLLSTKALSVSPGAAGNYAYLQCGYASPSVLDADAITMNFGSQYVQTLTIGNSTQTATVMLYGDDIQLHGTNTASINADTTVTIDANEINVGETTATQIDIGNTAAAVNIQAASLGLNGTTALSINAQSVSVANDTASVVVAVGNTAATSVTLSAGAGSVELNGAYVNIGNATTASNYVTIGAPTAGQARIGKQWTKASGGVTSLAVSTDDIGKMIVFAGDSTCTITLPAAESGLTLDLVVTSNASVATISAAAGDYFVDPADGGTASSYALSAHLMYRFVAVDGTKWFGGSWGATPAL